MGLTRKEKTVNFIIIAVCFLFGMITSCFF